MNADYYVTNTHKWLYAPKGAAVFYVRKDYQAELAPTVIAYEWKQGHFTSNFTFVGTRDYTSFTCLNASVEFRQKIGGERAIREYNHDLIWWAGNHLAKVFGATLLVPEAMVGSMVSQMATTGGAKFSDPLTLISLLLLHLD